MIPDCRKEVMTDSVTVFFLSAPSEPEGQLLLWVFHQVGRLYQSLSVFVFVYFVRPFVAWQ